MLNRSAAVAAAAVDALLVTFGAVVRDNTGGGQMPASDAGDLRGGVGVDVSAEERRVRCAVCLRAFVGSADAARALSAALTQSKREDCDGLGASLGSLIRSTSRVFGK